MASGCPSYKGNPFIFGFSFPPKGAQDAPKPHSGVAGVPLRPPKLTKNWKIREFQGDTRTPFGTPKKLKRIQGLFLACPPPLVTKSGPDKGGGDMTRLEADFRTSKLPTFLGTYPSKKCFFGYHFIENTTSRPYINWS